MLRNLKGRVCTLRAKFLETCNIAVLDKLERKNDVIPNIKSEILEP